jgi:hypothetical protein
VVLNVVLLDPVDVYARLAKAHIGSQASYTGVPTSVNEFVYALPFSPFWETSHPIAAIAMPLADVAVAEPDD